MRESWQKGIDRLPQKALEGKKVLSVDGTFDDFSSAGVDKGQADAVIIAQAFHWCPDYDSALVSRISTPFPCTNLICAARDCILPQARSTACPDLEH